MSFSSSQWFNIDDLGRARTQRHDDGTMSLVLTDNAAGSIQIIGYRDEIVAVFSQLAEALATQPIIPNVGESSELHYRPGE